MQVTGQVQVGELQVRVTNGRGRTPEEIADEAVNKILYVGENIHPLIRDQALAFKDQIRIILTQAIKQGIVSDRTTLATKLKLANQHDLIKLLEI
jgi:hypothetical protein